MELSECGRKLNMVWVASKRKITLVVLECNRLDCEKCFEKRVAYNREIINENKSEKMYWAVVEEKNVPSSKRRSKSCEMFFWSCPLSDGSSVILSPYATDLSAEWFSADLNTNDEVDSLVSGWLKCRHTKKRISHTRKPSNGSAKNEEVQESIPASSMTFNSRRYEDSADILKSRFVKVGKSTWIARESVSDDEVMEDIKAIERMTGSKMKTPKGEH